MKTIEITYKNGSKTETAKVSAASRLDFSKKTSNFEATYIDDNGKKQTIYVPKSTKFVW